MEAQTGFDMSLDLDRNNVTDSMPVTNVGRKAAYGTIPGQEQYLEATDGSYG